MACSPKSFGKTQTRKKRPLQAFLLNEYLELASHIHQKGFCQKGFFLCTHPGGTLPFLQLPDMAGKSEGSHEMGLVGKTAGLQPVTEAPMLQGGKIHVRRNILLADMIVRTIIDLMPMITYKCTRMLPFAVQAGRRIPIIDRQRESLLQGL